MPKSLSYSYFYFPLIFYQSYLRVLFPAHIFFCDRHPPRTAAQTYYQMTHGNVSRAYGHCASLFPFHHPLAPSSWEYGYRVSCSLKALFPGFGCLSLILNMGIRSSQLSVFVFLPLMLLFPLAILTPTRSLFLKGFVWLLYQSGGPAYIKLCQWASTRPDLLSADWIAALSTFHSSAPAHSGDYSREVIVHELLLPSGRTGVLEDYFTEFNPVPVGSGSIAQVHRARLKGSGIEVAIKILHPHIHERLLLDLQLLKLLVACLDMLVPSFKWIRLPDELAVLSRELLRQTDLRNEAFSLLKMNYYFSDEAWQGRVSFPTPVVEFCSRSVLVESYARGWPLSELFRLESLSAGRRPPGWLKSLNQNVVMIGFQAFLKMLLADNYVHADLHPGNLLVSLHRVSPALPAMEQEAPDGHVRDKNALMAELESCFHQDTLVQNIFQEESSPVVCVLRRMIEAGTLAPRLVFLDLGLVNELSPVEFYNFLDLFITVVIWRDGWRAGQLLIERAPGRRLKMHQKHTVDNQIEQWLSRSRLFRLFYSRKQNLRQERLEPELHALAHDGGDDSKVIEPEKFCRAIQELVRQFFTSHPPPRLHFPDTSNSTALSSSLSNRLLGSLPLSDYRISPILMSVLDLVRQHHVRLDDRYTNLIMSVIFVEGLGRRLAPGLDLLPFLKQAAFHYLFRS